ncbi:MAG: hypothetical protein IJ366_09195 [Clostridia bacterium]|nr:hypothetical protein [Clostridia bacterium]
MIDRIRKRFCEMPYEILDNMIIANRRPHTPSVESLERCSDGRETGAYYFLARYFDMIDDVQAEGIVSEIIKLQNTDESDRLYGCMRWYREEPYIFDTNGAFFVLLPFALAYVLCENKMTAGEKDGIRLMLERGGKWFQKECAGPIYYTNKITSDGAILALISKATGKYKEECRDFWNDWTEYADELGWGWGENISDCYSLITLNALSAACLAAPDEGIKVKIEQKRQELLEYVSFHNGKEFIPSIRSYNFSGDINYGGAVYKTLLKPELIVNFADLMSAVVINISAASSEAFGNSPAKSVKTQRIFKDSYAYTWKGDGLRLGSVSKFPAMPGCYQNDNWGLGWQSMPVSAMLEGEYVSFLRFRTKVNGNTHSHPAQDKHSAFLYNRLFEDNAIPDYQTRAAQNENILVAIRSISHIANTAEFVCDEWCIPGDRDVEIYETDNAVWYVVDNKIAVFPLNGVFAKSNTREKPTVKILKENGFTTISAIIYEGASTLLIAEYTEAAWIVTASKNVTEYLDKIKITDEKITDRTVPRMPCKQKRKITVSDGAKSAVLEYDPYN